MAVFLGFLVLSTIVLPAVSLSQAGQIALSLAFALTLVFGSFTTIRHRAATYLIAALALSTFVADLIARGGKSHDLVALDAALRVACLSSMFCVTLERTLRPGRINGFRVLGGIAGYLLIGLTWTFAYQALVQECPSAIHFEPGVAEGFPGQPSHLVYFSFMTLTTVGFGDIHPVTPVARSLTVAEALVGQLYVAILIASLVGMALQGSSVKGSESGGRSNTRPSARPKSRPNRSRRKSLNTNEYGANKHIEEP